MDFNIFGYIIVACLVFVILGYGAMQYRKRNTGNSRRKKSRTPDDAAKEFDMRAELENLAKWQRELEARVS